VLKMAKTDNKWIRRYNLNMDVTEYYRHEKRYNKLMEKHRRIIKNITENKIPKWEKEMKMSFSEDELKTIKINIEAPKNSERWNTMSSLKDFYNFAIKPHCWDCKYVKGANWCNYNQKTAVPQNPPCKDFELKPWEVKKVKKARADIRINIIRYENVLEKLESYKPRKYVNYLDSIERKRWKKLEKEWKQQEIEYQKSKKKYALYKKEHNRREKINEKARIPYLKAWRKITFGDPPYDYKGTKAIYKKYLKVLKDLGYTGRIKIVEEEILNIDKIKQREINKVKQERYKKKQEKARKIQQRIKQEKEKQKQHRLNKIKKEYGERLSLTNAIKYYKKKYNKNPIQRGSPTKEFRRFLYEHNGIPRSVLGSSDLFKLKKEYRSISYKTLDFI
jgi:hypothetical protein